MFKKNAYKIVDITEKALNLYQNHIRDNKNENKEMDCKKLTRNILCSKLISKENDLSTYAYGCMRIVVNDKNTVVHIINYCEPICFDKRLKKKLDRELGIVNNSVNIDVVSKFKKLLGTV